MADGDLISRASLLAGIAELKESPWYKFGKVDGTSPDRVEAIWHYGYLQRKEAVEIIEDLCIKKEPAVLADSGWIKVKDKMPDEGEEVLIYCPEFLEKIRKAFYIEDDFYVEKEDLIVRPFPNGYCTHWQPLSEPPKEDKDETNQ